MKEIDWKKIEALRTYILEECKKQGFTVREVEQLAYSIQTVVTFREEELKNELFFENKIVSGKEFFQKFGLKSPGKNLGENF